MPPLFQYFLKLSCSLALVYLFYHLVLRRLTFYNANRWYLLSYPVLCFFIPFVNITGLMERHQLTGSRVVQAIPALEQFTGFSKPIRQQNNLLLFTEWDACLAAFVLGVVVLLVRLLLQYRSYRRMRKGAQLVTGTGIKLYQVDADVMPFSFGDSIFINRRLHSEADLREIIRHEYVHVTQRHTIDIVLNEVLCLLNWYNPFVWLLRHAVRQNLEFIADNRVVQSGIDKKKYQYLLLKVMGAAQFRIAAPFNFSSLKKRIAMMNKLKSAKAHLLKFLFILPLLAVLLVAFRNVVHKNTAANKPVLTISGLVVDAATQAPLTGVSLQETYSKATSTTDARGFFSIAVPITSNPVQTEVQFTNEGFENISSNSTLTTKKPEAAIGMVEIIGMTKTGTSREDGFVQSYSLSGDNPSISVTPTYDKVLKFFRHFQIYRQTNALLRESIKGSEQPYWLINGHSFVVTKEGSWASTDEPTNIVFVDGKQMTGDEVNRTIKRSSFTSVAAMEREASQKKYGLNQPVFEIFIHTKNPMDTVPAPLPPQVSAPEVEMLPEDYEAFLKRNPEVRDIYWNARSVIINLKSGEKETYRLNDAKSLAAAVKRWGALPVAPPPPPPVVAPPPPPPVDTVEVLTDVGNTTEANTQKIALNAQLQQLNASIHDSKRNQNGKAMRSYLSERSIALQKEQQALQAKMQKEQLVSLQEHQALLQHIHKEQEAQILEQKAAQDQLQQTQIELRRDKEIRNKETIERNAAEQIEVDEEIRLRDAAEQLELNKEIIRRNKSSSIEQKALQEGLRKKQQRQKQQ